ncbi:MAG: sulfur carrier protein ThiS [Chlorobiaceae bacterium]|nr:sulfur carrier protein ThiS [Chlorobiaceae bacterium]
MIRIELNGQPREIPDGSSITDLLAIDGADRRQVAVVVNELVIRPDDRSAHILRKGDQVDVLVFAGGG